MSYVDPNTVHNPATGTVAPAAWGDVVRDDLEFLIDPPACSVFHSSNQSVTTGTLTVLLADSENFDNDAMHSTVSNTSRITVQTEGRYLFIALVSFAGSASGARTVSFLEDGTTVHNGALVANAGGSTNRVLALRLFSLTVGQYIEVRVSQDSGGNLLTALVEFGATYLTR